MNWILKNKKIVSWNSFYNDFIQNKRIIKEKKSKALFVALFIVFGFVLFGNIGSASASCTCQVKGQDGKLSSTEAAANTGPTESDCNATCLSWGGASNSASYAWNGNAFKVATAPSASTGLAASAGAGSLQIGSVNKMKTVNVDGHCEAGMFECAVGSLLTGVQALVGWLFAIAATLFAWAIEPANISGPNGLLNKQAVKDVWIMVRDLLNMTFILILLFAAFCTIFQVDKWNLKKVWLNILINALLVNFSYPIARFFIDVSNVAFYYFVNNLFSSTTTVTGSGIFAMFGSASSIGAILKPDAFTQNPISYQIAMIIFTFIMGMTLIIIAALFIVRLIALTMLVMFSPVGFVGYIFPSTAGFADKWWKQLFAYSFFAPVMIFIMAIALRIAESLKAENINSMMANASVNTTNDQTTWIANAAFYMIPIIILWMGIGVAKSMGIEGADKVVGAVKKGGKWLASNPALGMGGYAWKRSGVPGGIKKGYENAQKSGKLFGSEKLGWILKNGQEGRENKVSGYMDNRMKGVNDAVEKKKAEEFRKKAKEKADEHDDKNGVALADEIYRLNLNDSKDGEKNAMKVASMLHHLKSDSSKKDEYDAHLMSSILSDPIHTGNMSGMDSSKKDAYVKTAMSEHWKQLNKKAKQAHNVAVKKELPGDAQVNEAPKPVSRSSTFSGGGGI